MSVATVRRPVAVAEAHRLRLLYGVNTIFVATDSVHDPLPPWGPRAAAPPARPPGTRQRVCLHVRHDLEHILRYRVIDGKSKVQTGGEKLLFAQGAITQELRRNRSARFFCARWGHTLLTRVFGNRWDMKDCGLARAGI
jgi:hypothetical protein